MIPIDYIQTGEVAKFRYNLGELKEWIRIGNQEGTTGPILISIDYSPGGFSRYASYGTLENPGTRRVYLNFKTFSPFGPPPTPEQVVYPKPLSERYPNAGYFVPLTSGAELEFKQRTAAFIDSLKSPRGGWTKAALETLGVKWPPEKGWRQKLIDQANLVVRYK